MSDIKLLDISNEEYHASPGYSSTMLKLLPDDPMLFAGRHISKTMPFKRTAAMELGTNVHRALLDDTPTKVIPDDVLTKSKAKAGNAWKDFRAEHEASNVLVKEDDPIRHILANLRAHKMVKRLLAASVFREQSIFWTDEATGLAMRSRADDVALFPKAAKPVKLWDLKTANDVRPHKRRAQISELKYHRSLDHYSTGSAKAGAAGLLNWDGLIDEVLIVWAQTTEPYTVVVDPIAERAISRAHDQNLAAYEDLARRLALHAGGHAEAWEPNDYHLVQPPLDLPEWEYERE